MKKLQKVESSLLYKKKSAAVSVEAVHISQQLQTVTPAGMSGVCVFRENLKNDHLDRSVPDQGAT
jgi:hypothetical protein